MPVLTTPVAMPAYCGALASLTSVQLSVKPGISRPIRPNHASVTAAGHFTPSSHGSHESMYSSTTARIRPRRLPSRSDRRPMISAPIATPSSSTLACWAASTRVKPRVSCRNGTAHRPAKARKLPPTPTLTMNGGQVAGLASTSRSAVSQCTEAAPAVVDGLTGAKPNASGRSRTRSQVASASTAESTASATNTLRHEVQVTTHASGEPAATAPRLPTNMVTPASVAKRVGSNHTEPIFRMAMNVTDTPMPTSVRPTAATSQTGASANSSEPAAAIAPPQVRMRRGPSVSASTPTGICSSV